MWDIALVSVPFGVWWLLVAANLRVKSLSNFIELLTLIPVLATVLAIRTYIATQRPQMARPQVAFAIGLAFTVLLYTFVPALPE